MLLCLRSSKRELLLLLLSVLLVVLFSLSTLYRIDTFLLFTMLQTQFTILNAF